jgi:mercuric ion transport protein
MSITTTDTTCARKALDEEGAPTRTKVAGLLALLACVGCCALPYLIVGGLITGAGAAVLQQTLIAVAIGLGVLALGMWRQRRRQLAKRAPADGETGCGDPNCVC